MGSKLKIGIVVLFLLEGLLQGSPALADHVVLRDTDGEPGIKATKHGQQYPGAWTDYHGSHGVKDKWLIWFRKGLLK